MIQRRIFRISHDVRVQDKRTGCLPDHYCGDWSARVSLRVSAAFHSYTQFEHVVSSRSPVYTRTRTHSHKYTLTYTHSHTHTRARALAYTHTLTHSRGCVNTLKHVCTQYFDIVYQH